jgi:carbon monoxide dehydrogenase subunit G
MMPAGLTATLESHASFSATAQVAPQGLFTGPVLEKLLKGDVLLNPQPHTAKGGAVSATMYIPRDRGIVWAQLTQYSRWTDYFPEITRSDVIIEFSATRKRLSQSACKTFFMVNISVDIHLNAIETADRQIQFQMVGTNDGFQDFSANLTLEDCHSGTALTYSVQATPKIPVPAPLIQEAMKIDLPINMRHMRGVLVQG